MTLLRPIFRASFLGVAWQQMGNGPIVTIILHILIQHNTGGNIGMCEQGLKLGCWNIMWNRDTKDGRWHKRNGWFGNKPIVLILQVIPSQKQYVANFFDELRASMNTRTGESQQEMMMGSHRRNREHGESKLKFQVGSIHTRRNCDHRQYN